MAGVTVQVKNGKATTTTKTDGTFQINAPSANSVLVFTSVGFGEQQVPVNNQRDLSVSLTQSTAALESVVVVGYGTQRSTPKGWVRCRNKCYAAAINGRKKKGICRRRLRCHHLVRSGLVETVIPAWIASEDIQKAIKPFDKNYIIYPVPQSELDVRQGLYTQNTGY